MDSMANSGNQPKHHSLAKKIAVRWEVRKPMMPKLTPEMISAAIDGFEAQKRRIDTTLAELRAMLAGPAKPAATPKPPKRKRRTMSAEGRKAVSEATKKRWAAFHAAKQAEKAEQPGSDKPKEIASKPAKKSAPAKKTVTKKTITIPAPAASETV